MTIELSQYYDRFDPANHYERHLFLAGSVLQSAELNELQSASMHRLKMATDALFSDGSVLSGASVVVDQNTGLCTCEAGAIYLRGAVRGVVPGSFTISMTGDVSLGVYLHESIVTDLQEPALRDPAVSLRNYQESGASRLRVDPTWGFDGDGQDGDFFAVYAVEDGIVLSKAPPPDVDAISMAISRYDRQSAGGYYVSDGMAVTRLADEGGKQVYSMAKGTARVGGEEIIRSHARRFLYDAQPDTRTVSLEPHIAAGGTERVELNFTPIHAVTSIAITRQEAVAVIHGAYSGAMDLLPKSPVVQIVAVTKDATTYVAGVDYQLTADKVDWSLAGAEPAPGATYNVVYRYIASVAPIDLDDTGFTVENAVVGSLIQTTYEWSMPRYDLIALDSAGEGQFVKGVAAPERPRVPNTPHGLLAIATIHQKWDATTSVDNNAVRVVPMDELNRVNARIDTLFALVAEQRLLLDITDRDPTAKKGVFADPFSDDDFRDDGIAQTAAIYADSLHLGVDATPHNASLPGPVSLDARILVEIDETVGPDEVVIEQPLRTGDTLINPYSAFAPLPGVAVLSPAVDYWVETVTNWLSPVSRVFHEGDWSSTGGVSIGSGFTGAPVSYTQWQEELSSVSSLGQSTQLIQFLRPIEVQFTLSGFGPNEQLQAVRFDGVDVAFTEVA